MTWFPAFIYPPDVTTPESQSRKAISFGVAGLIFGALLGFVAAHEMYGGREAMVTAGAAGQAPAATGGGMGGARPSGAPPGPAGGAPSMDEMEMVTRELNALKEHIKQDPRDVSALARLGNLYMDAGMFEQAAGYYATALEVEPGNSDVRTDRGTCLRQLGRPAEALAEFQESLSRDPTHWKSWFNTGIVYLYDLGEYGKAEEAFRKVLDLNPGSFDMEAVLSEIDKIRKEKSGSGAPS